MIRHRVFDTGDHFDGASAFAARLDVDVEYPFKALCPCHRGTALGRGLRFVRCLALLPPDPLSRGYQRAIVAVRGEDAVVARQVDARRRDERGEPGNGPVTIASQLQYGPVMTPAVSAPTC